MSQTFRLNEIAQMAQTDGRVAVEDLAARFDVSVQTIRRDLAELAKAGRLERVHGGAVPASGVTNIGYDERRMLNRDAKEAMAQACARAIPDGASVLLNIGTSTEAVARALLHHRDLMVVTNNMNVANILVANPDCEIVVAGGILRRTDGGLVGTLTAAALDQFRVDYAVIGCSALDIEGDLLDFDAQEVHISRAIIARARQTFLVADHSKFERQAPVRIAALRDVDAFYTDQPPPARTQDLCAAWGVAVHLCAKEA